MDKHRVLRDPNTQDITDFPLHSFTFSSGTKVIDGRGLLTPIRDPGRWHGMITFVASSASITISDQVNRRKSANCMYLDKLCITKVVRVREL